MKKLLPVLILFFVLNSFSQKEANFWYFGNKAALDFNSGNPVPVAGSKLNTTEGCSSFSNADGELLFYVGAPSPRTTNLTIWNKNNEAMPNGIGLQGDASSSQSALTIPAPGKPNIYYLFTVGAQSSSNAGFWYYTIDMTKENGLGDIVAGPVILGNRRDHNNWTEKVTAVRAKECNSFWVISSHADNFYAYKVNASGVDINNPVISKINSYNAADARGYLKVSPDGTKLVAANMNAGTFIFNFNDENGKVTNLNNSTTPSRLRISGDGYGVEFSSSSERLYVSTGSFQNNSRENLYQFDLTQPLLSGINNSRYTVHSYSNTRGALQLGPNGKIYWTSDNSNKISVINRPQELGENCNYSHRAVNLGGPSTTATQGLPPFISSLLLPIEIKDSDTGISINNQDLEYCVGQSKMLTSQDVEGINKTYEWSYIDNSLTPIILSTTPNLALNNLQLSDSGRYSLKIELTDDCGNITQYNGTFNINVFEKAVATKPTNFIFCDTDRDGFNSFDLKADKNAEILNGLDDLTFEVLYFESIENANTKTNPLENPFTNSSAFSSQTIFARVHNKFAVDACFDITEFTLAVTDLPIATEPKPYRICDDIESGDDTDGIINTFLLNTKDDEILGALDKNQYNITYHTTQNGADTNDATTIIDKNSNHTVTNAQTVFIRIENKDNINCYDASETLELIVDPLPSVTNVDLLQCDDDLDRVSTVNLTEAEISISTNYLNETFTYFETEAHAIAGTPEIADKFRYPVNLNGEAWVRTISDKNCYRISKINLEVEAAADVAYNKEFTAICDDFLQKDGTNGTANNDTDGITNFDFSVANTEILAFFPATLQSDLEVSYFETREDRTAVLNPILDISNYRNINYPSNITKQTIYFKITNKNNNNCSGTGELYLKTNPVPTANPVANLELCDNAIDGNASNGIVQTFNLENQTSTILGSQDDTNFTVTYHLSVDDANAGNNSQKLLFTNTIRDLQPIFVRVTNNSTGCFTAQTSFNVIVNPIPIANFVEDLEVCDDNSDGSARNGFSQNIDLSSQTAGILGTQDATINKVTYHRSLADAQNGDNSVVSPYTNLIPNRETIFVRIFNQNTQCANGISNFDVIINPEPVFVVPTNLAYCDNTLDDDDSNGIIQNIDFDSKISEVLGATQNPDDYNVTFHISQADATSGDKPISSPYENTNATETIFIRIQNKATFCVNDDATFELIVNPLPDFTVTTPQILCLNNSPLNIVVENTKDMYTYQWQDEIGNVLSTNDNLDVTKAGSYKVIATSTNGTFCKREETIVINESNVATLESSFVTIVDEGNNISSANNLSISIDIINNNLGPGDYRFAILNTDNNERFPFAGFQEEPLFENLEGGVYQIIVNDKNGCVSDTTLLVSVIQFPKFFTPNADGKNDTWEIKGANKIFYPNASINIFNRFGKLVGQSPIDGEGWNGMYQGKILPSDDYWYNITLIPADNTKPTINKKGNFSLLRK